MRTLQAARSILVQDRMDWNRPHLAWLPKRLYLNLKRLF